MKACLNSEGEAERENGASCGDTVTEGTPKPHQPPPTWFAKCWWRQLRVAVTSTQDLNEGLAACCGTLESLSCEQTVV